MKPTIFKRKDWDIYRLRLKIARRPFSGSRSGSVSFGAGDLIFIKTYLHNLLNLL
ncbi:MAG: hypothetical protein FWD26_07760 [Treponema sp.]|nr:hypothetical protein [Treponema sp.]